MQIDILKNLPSGDFLVVVVAAIFSGVVVGIIGLVWTIRSLRARRESSGAPARPAQKKQKKKSGPSQSAQATPDTPETPDHSPTEMPAPSHNAGASEGTNAPNPGRVGSMAAPQPWIQEVEIRPIAVTESSESATELPEAWKEQDPKTHSSQPAPILDIESQRVDSALVSIPEYPVTMGDALTKATMQDEPQAISQHDGLFDVYRNLPFLRSHLKQGLETADLFFPDMGGAIAANSHPYVLFLPEFAHDPEIRRKTESILQTAASGYMQRGMDRLAPIEREALPWTIRFLFWKGRLDKAMSLLYRIRSGPEYLRIRGLLAACLEDPLLSRAFPVAFESYDQGLLGVPSEHLSGLRSALAFQGASDTEDFKALRPFADLDRRNGRWLYLYLLHRGHLFLAFRLALELSYHDSTFEDECIYLAGIQGRYRLILRLLLRLPARNTFFRLAALKHAINQLDTEGKEYLERLRKHWPEATEEAVESVEPFAEFRGADSMRRQPAVPELDQASVADRSELLDWMDLAAYRSRSGFHSGAVGRAASLFYTVLHSHRPARSGFQGRADRFFKKAARVSPLARHFYVLWLSESGNQTEARRMAEYFVRRFPDVSYFHRQFVRLSRG